MMHCKFSYRIMSFNFIFYANFSEGHLEVYFSRIKRLDWVLLQNSNPNSLVAIRNDASSCDTASWLNPTVSSFASGLVECKYPEKQNNGAFIGFACPIPVHKMIFLKTETFNPRFLAPRFR